VLTRKLEFDLELTLRLVLLPYRHSEKCSATYVRRLVAPSNYQNNGTAIPINRKLLPLIDTAIPLRRGSDWWKNPTKNFSLLLAITSTTETRSFNRPVNRFLRVSVVMQLYPQEVIPVLVVTAIEEVEVVV
jgi:hypothetical protein